MASSQLLFVTVEPSLTATSPPAGSPYIGSCFTIIIITVIPVKEMDLNLNKREFKDAVHLRYDRQIKVNGWGASLYNVITGYGILRHKCLTWFVMMLKLNPFCRRLPVSLLPYMS